MSPRVWLLPSSEGVVLPHSCSGAAPLHGHGWGRAAVRAGAWMLGVPLAPCSPASPQPPHCLSGC